MPDAQPPECYVHGVEINCATGVGTFRGIATDNVAVDHVSWVNVTTFASGTCNWSDPNWDCDITLASGNNDIVVTAYDTSSNSGADSFYIVYTPCPVVDALKKYYTDRRLGNWQLG